MDDLISRQAAIDALGEEPEVWTGKDEYAQGLNNQWHYDINAIKALPSAQPSYTDEQIQKMQELEQAEIEKAFQLGREDAQPEPQWIPMTEREPEFGNYLTTFREKATGKVDVAMDLYWSGGWDDDGDKLETIAWMPLPEPYKGDE